MEEDLEDYQDHIDEFGDDQPDEDVQELMASYGLDEETAEEARDLMDEYGVDEDEAVELAEEGF